MTSAIIAVCVTYYQFPPIGYAGVVFVSSVAIVLTIGAAGLSLLLATVLFVRRKQPKPLNATVMSVVSLALAFAFVWTM